MVYMDRTTGKPIGDLDHLRQSIIDILTTPVGSRVYRREYGADLFRLVDQPINRTLISRMYAAIAQALDEWEPRLQVTAIRLDVSLAQEGCLGMDIEGIYLPNGEPVRLEGIEVQR